MSITLLTAAARAPQAWRNGGGVTFEVARAAAPAGAALEFLWRVSIARVERAGPFSSFAGFERLITVIDGTGMTLRGLAPEDIELRPCEVLCFDGAASVAGLLPGGPVSDLNVIYDPRRCRARLTIIEHALRERRAACAHLLLLNLADGPIECSCDGGSQRMELHDALWIRAPDAIVSCARLERAAMIEIDAALQYRVS